MRGFQGGLVVHALSLSPPLFTFFLFFYYPDRPWMLQTRTCPLQSITDDLKKRQPTDTGLIRGYRGLSAAFIDSEQKVEARFIKGAIIGAELSRTEVVCRQQENGRRTA